MFSLEVVSPERTPAGTSIAWRFSGNSTKVTVFPKNTWTTLLYLLFLSPSSVLFYVLLYFILFIYYSFILSQSTFKLFSVPRNYPLTPFTPVQPNLPSKSSDLCGQLLLRCELLVSSRYNTNFHLVYLKRYKTRLLSLPVYVTVR